MKECDAIMVARGDLGVRIQWGKCQLSKKIGSEAKLHAKPVIIATQMMRTMMNSLTNKSRGK